MFGSWSDDTAKIADPGTALHSAEDQKLAGSSTSRFRPLLDRDTPAWDERLQVRIGIRRRAQRLGLTRRREVSILCSQL
jgi:hypothetical protein